MTIIKPVTKFEKFLYLLKITTASIIKQINVNIEVKIITVFAEPSKFAESNELQAKIANIAIIIFAKNAHKANFAIPDISCNLEFLFSILSSSFNLACFF